MVKAVLRVHNKNICHRDIKPSNFLLFKDKLCLSDFGTAKNLLERDNKIRDKYVMPVGDIYYIAPELFFEIGIADEYVYRADIFSIGAILFELFTGEIFTSQIYTQDVVASFMRAKQILFQMQPDKRFETYNLLIEHISRKITIPDIYSFNSNVPNCIKNQLNSLFNSLVEIDFKKRLYNSSSIYRQMDICIKTLGNEKNYLKWREEKRKRWEIRQKKFQNQNKG